MGMDGAQVAALRAGVGLALLKAKVAPEVADLVALEVGLRRKLVALHEAAATDAIRAAITAARGQADPGQAAQAAQDAVAKAYRKRQEPAAAVLLTAAVPTFYALGKSAAVRKATGKVDGTLRVDLPAGERPAVVPQDKGAVAKAATLAKAPASASGPRRNNLDLDTSFTVQDRRAQAALVDHQVFWVGKHYEDNVSDRIASVAKGTIVDAGLGSDAAAKALAPALASEFGIDPDLAAMLGVPAGEVPVPAGFKGTDREYFRALASNAATTGRVYGSVAGLREVGVTKLEIVNPLDERTCMRCSRMDGKVFTVEAAAAQADGVLAAKKPDDVRKLQPWLKIKTFTALVPAGPLDDKAAAAAAAAGILLPPYHFNCFPAGVAVEGRFVAGLRGHYAGQLVQIETAGGNRLRVTPNHPILTPQGFVPAGTLRQGDQVFRHLGGVQDQDAGRPADMYDHGGPARIEDVFQALAQDNAPLAAVVRPLDFHGDAANMQGEIHVAAPNHGLLFNVAAQLAQGGRDFSFATPNAAALGGGQLGLDGSGALAAADSRPGGATLPDGGVPVHAGPLQPFRVGPAAQLHASRFEVPGQGGPGHAQLLGQLQQRHPGAVVLDHIVKIGNEEFCGHVYDLQTEGGWYVAQGVIVSNCRCTVDVAPGAATISAPPPPPPKPLEPWERPFPHAPDDLIDLGRQGLGGAHEKTVLRDPDGGEWIYKPLHNPAEDFLAYGEKAASDLAQRLGVEAPEMHVIKVRGRVGTAQRKLPGVKGDFESGVEAPGLSVDDWDYVQREAAYNFLIGDNDGHSGNFLRMTDGRVVGIDKGQLFKFYGRDVLDWDYNPNQGFHGGSMDRVLLRKYASGQYGADYTLPPPDKLVRLQKFLDDLDALPDADLIAAVRPYAQRAAQLRIGVFGQWSEDDFYARVLDRKRGLRKGWAEYMERAEAARRKALDLDGPPALVDKAWIQAMQDSKGNGRSILVAGPQVEDGNLLVYGTANDGTWIDAKLRPDADRALTALLRSKATPGRAGRAAPVAAPAAVPDPHWSDMLLFAKSYNFHLDPASSGFDGVLPQHTATKWEFLLFTLQDDPSDLAADYIQQLSKFVTNFDDVINQGLSPKFKLGTDAVLASKGAAIKPWKPPVAPAVPAPKVPAAGAPGVKVTAHAKTGVRRAYSDGQVQILGLDPVEWDAPSYEIDLGDGVRAYYVPHEGAGGYATTGEGHWSKAGFLQVHVDTAAGDMTPARLQGALDKLDALGLPKLPAMDADYLEAMYLRKVAYTAGHVDSIPAFAVPDTLPAKDQVRRLRAAWQGVLGRDPSTLPGYDPTPKWDSGKDMDGVPRWQRFDFSEADVKDLRENYVLTHETGQGPLATLRVLLGGTNTIAGTEERIRLGITTQANVHAIGQSAWADQRSGGASYAFTRARPKTDYRATSEDFIFSGDLLLDPDALGYGFDRFGVADPESVRKFRRNRTAEGIRRMTVGADEPDIKGGNRNEFMLRRRMSLENLVRINVPDATARRDALAQFAAAGVKTLGGRPVDQIVQIKGTDL